MRINVKKIFIVAAIIFIIVGIIFMLTEVLYPRDDTVKCSLDGKEALKLERYEKEEHYYVSFKRQGREKVFECTKEQYDFMANVKQIYILYRENYFNRNKGEILKVDEVPIANYLRGM
jgi:hypothetical protein